MAALWIKALRGGFRRAGVAHPAAWTAHPDGAFDAVQEAALRAEAMLQVQDADPEPAPEPEPEPETAEAAAPKAPAAKKR